MNYILYYETLEVSENIPRSIKEQNLVYLAINKNSNGRYGDICQEQKM